MKIADSEASEEAYQRTSTEAEDADDISLNDLLVDVLARRLGPAPDGRR